MGQKIIKFLSVFYLAIFIFTGVALAVPILDQDSGVDLTSSDKFGIGGGSIRGQSFTVGIDGILDSIDVMISVTDDTVTTTELDLKLVAGESAFAEPAVAAAVIPIDSLTNDPEWVNVNLSSASLSIAAGEVYTIWLSTSAGELWHAAWYLGQESPGGPYPDGRMFISVATFGNIEQDTGFRTYVDVGEPVPEPATMLLLTTGLIGIAGFSRMKLRKK